MSTASELEARVQALLAAHPEALPFGLQVQEVQLLGGPDRKRLRRRRATARAPRPEGNFLLIKLADAAATPAPVVVEDEEARWTELLRALYEAEQSPGHSFVALKWFRDTVLPQRYGWAASAERRDRVLRAVTGRGWASVERIPNPRHPGFDTAVLRLQAAEPEVQRRLGLEPKLGWGFQRIKLEGEPVSETLRKMRDERY